MLLAEVVFNRELVKTPHPMYERFWLVSWIKISPKDMKALWVFKNKEEWEAAKKNYRVSGLIMDKYAGDYMVSFVSDNGVYCRAVIDYNYVNRHGSSMAILGASFTEKSAWAAAKKAVEDKGHRWDPNMYSLLSIEPRDPSIFKLDPDEDIDAISEGIGADTLRFADYLATTRATPQAKKDMSKLASMLLKRGFELLELHEFGPVRLVNEEDEMAGFGFSFLFPDAKDGHQRQGIVTVAYVVFRENNKGEQAMHRWTGHYSATEILDMGLDKFMDHARASARPVR